MPRRNGGVTLPTDTPPRSATGPLVQGIITTGSLGERWVPVQAPFSTFQSDTFPKVFPSKVAPNAIKPTFMVAANKYSPISHRSFNGTFRSLFCPDVATAQPVQNLVGPYARPPQRFAMKPRPYALGYVTAWPMRTPQWPTWGQAPPNG